MHRAATRLLIGHYKNDVTPACAALVCADLKPPLQSRHPPRCLADERKPASSAPSEAGGILKADWFQKHRQRRPAVAALFLNW